MTVIEYAKENASKLFREPAGQLKYPFLVPGATYQRELWDWDSWLTNLALRKIGTAQELDEYEKGCGQAENDAELFENTLHTVPPIMGCTLHILHSHYQKLPGLSRK